MLGINYINQSCVSFTLMFIVILRVMNEKYSDESNSFSTTKSVNLKILDLMSNICKETMLVKRVYDAFFH